MSLKKEKYIERLIDKKISRYLKVFGALSIEGPKWCGKTWTSLNHANSIVSFDDNNYKELALLDPNSVLNEDRPELVDEWTRVPAVWDAVRSKCDESSEKGNFILTSSTSLIKSEEENKVFHSGAGRFARIEMYTMSLFESGDSTGEASIMDMYNGTQKSLISKKNNSIEVLADLIIRGGWPSNLNVSSEDVGLIPKEYIKAVLNKDIDDDKKRDQKKMLMLLKSLARNETTLCSVNALLKDIFENETDHDRLSSRETLEDYLDVLYRLHLLNDQPSFSTNYRSSKRIGVSSKRHFTDPSLACACLELNQSKLIKDLNTFGFMFEALVERDLNIYMDYLNGKLFHFRDNTSGDEVDAILEFEDGEYAAIEIKLGFNQSEAAKKSLMKFYQNVKKKPKFMAIIYGVGNGIVKDQETGIYIIPITALKP